PIESEAVAAGEGALQTFTTNSFSKIKKSSIRLPCSSQAWARTPAPPGSKSSPRISGTSFWSDSTKAFFEKERYISSQPSRQYLRATFLKPAKRSVCHNSPQCTSRFV